MKWEAERTDDDWTPEEGGWQVSLCMRAREQMKMRRRAQLYANFMTVPGVMAVTPFYHLSFSVSFSNLHSCPPQPILFSVFGLFVQFCSLSSRLFTPLSFCRPTLLSFIHWEWATSIHHTVTCLCYRLQLMHPIDFMSEKPHTLFHHTYSHNISQLSEQAETNSSSYFHLLKSPNYHRISSRAQLIYLPVLNFITGVAYSAYFVDFLIMSCTDISH